MDGRHLEWEGCWNARDLGGLPTAGGGQTRRGAVVRADALDELTASGWAALLAHGVRTIIDLRNDDEIVADAAPRPAGVTTLRLPLDCIEDRAFWEPWNSGWQCATPLYYAPHIARFPERSARVVAVVAHAPAGGVLVHCKAGRDRTGMITALILALCGVPIDAIAADYAESAGRLRVRWAARGERDQDTLIDLFLRGRGTSAAEELARFVAAPETLPALAAGGVTGNVVDALRARLAPAGRDR